MYGCGANKSGQLGTGSKLDFLSTVDKVALDVAISSASGGLDSSLFVSNTGIGNKEIIISYLQVHLATKQFRRTF